MARDPIVTRFTKIGGGVTTHSHVRFKFRCFDNRSALTLKLHQKQTYLFRARSFIAKHGVLLVITKHTKTNDTSTSLSFTQHNSYFVKNKIIILFFLFFLFILLATDNCHRASSLAISVSQHCERAFRTPFICLCAPYMKRHSLRRSIEPKEGHKTTGASKNIFSILYLMYRSKCSL